MMSLLLLLYILTGVVISAQKCHFPNYLQSHDNEPWLIIRSDLLHQQLFIKGGLITAKGQYSNDYELFTESCEEDVGDGKFLVLYSDRNNPGLYKCVQYFDRSLSVVQRSASNSSVYKRRYMCNDENLVLSPWPLIYVKHVNTHDIVCPLVGGFDMTIHNPDGSMKCNHRLLPLRLESECEAGEGMTFKFRYADCVDSDWDVNYNEQKVSCIASWTRDVKTTWKTFQYTFIALRLTATYVTKFWCMRFESHATGTLFQAHLFMDFVCDEGDEITHTDNYVVIDLSPRVFDNPCADENEDCITQYPNVCETDEKANCPKTCKVCDPDTEIATCEFNEGTQGKWLLSSQKERRNISINRSIMNVEKYGKFSCHYVPSASFPDREVLLQQFDNGCHPRFLCLDLATVPRSNSVIKFRLGTPIPWPLFHKDHLKQYVCSNSRFDGGDIHARRSSQVLVKPKRTQSVKCKLPEYHVSVLGLMDHNMCQACLYHNQRHRTRTMEVTFMNCTNQGSPVRYQYTCMSRLKLGLKLGDQKVGFNGLITRSTTDPHKFLCWVFPEKGRMFTVLPGDCSEDIVRAVKFRDVTPMHHWDVYENAEFCRDSTKHITLPPTRVPPVTRRNNNGYTAYGKTRKNGNNLHPHLATTPRYQKNVGSVKVPNRVDTLNSSKYFLLVALISQLCLL